MVRSCWLPMNLLIRWSNGVERFAPQGLIVAWDAASSYHQGRVFSDVKLLPIELQLPPFRKGEALCIQFVFSCLFGCTKLRPIV